MLQDEMDAHPPTWGDFLWNEDDNLIDDLCPQLIEEWMARRE